tara:strand:- start:9401 stop:10315 length:915 start_codon:yes stop_codon:yes gene_type:complete
MKKILITGSEGFIGKHLIRKLNRKNVNLFGSFYKNKKFKSSRNLKYIKCDFRNENQIKDLIKKVSPDIIFHLAAKSHPTYSFKNPIQTIETNVMGTLKLFEICKNQNINPKIVVACSSAQFGSKKKNELPITEESKSFPEHIYGFSKLVQSLLSDQYFKMFNLQIFKAIIFNTSGPGKNFDVFQDICNQYLRQKNKKKIIIETGNLKNLRDFSHVDDVANALIQISKKGVPGESYIIASSRLEKISKIISILKKLTNKNITIRKNKKLFRKFDEKFILGNNRKIKKLDWSSKKNLEDIVKDIIF